MRNIYCICRGTNNGLADFFSHSNINRHEMAIVHVLYASSELRFFPRPLRHAADHETMIRVGNVLHQLVTAGNGEREKLTIKIEKMEFMAFHFGRFVRVTHGFHFRYCFVILSHIFISMLFALSFCAGSKLIFASTEQKADASVSP